MWISWALLDLRSGALTGSANMSGTTMTASMVKAWIVADYLSRFGPHESLSGIIRHSDNETAWEIYRQLGREDSIHRMISACGLTDSSPGEDVMLRSSPGEDLSMTLMSARDAVRLGACLAAGPSASWLLQEMRLVCGIGDFGIRQAFPVAQRSRIAIKNGWETRQSLGEWNVNCLAITDHWVLSVLTRYSIHLPLDYGAFACQQKALELRELGALDI